MSNENRKFACIPDEQSGLFRIRALRDVGNESLGWIVREGEDGGLVSNEETLDMHDESWIDYSARAINSTISGSCHVYENAFIEDSTIRNNARIYGNTTVVNSTIDGSVQIFGNTFIKDSTIVGERILIADDAVIKNNTVIRADNITINKKAYIVHQKMNVGNITIDEKVDGNIKMILRIRCGMPVDNRYKVYKLVKSTITDGVYSSIYNENCLYDTTTSPILKETQYDISQDRICARGIHCSFDKKFDRFGIEEKADRLLTCLVDIDDIVSMDLTRGSNPKLRVKKLRVRTAEKWPIEEVDELPSLTLTHGLDTTYLIPVIYNNHSYELFRKYALYPTSSNSAFIRFDIDKETDSVDNYNFTVLAPNEKGMKNIHDPTKFSTEITGDGSTRTFYIEHSLNSRNLIPTVFTGRGDGDTEYTDHSSRKNVTNDCTIIFDELNRVTIGFENPPADGDVYTILLVRPATPANTSQAGTESDRGLLNLSNKANVILFQGSDVDEVTGKIQFKHDMSTYNVFGVIYDTTDNTYHLFDFDLERSDPDAVTLTLNFQYFRNHIYAFVYAWAY